MHASDCSAAACRTPTLHGLLLLLLHIFSLLGCYVTPACRSSTPVHATANGAPASAPSNNGSRQSVDVRNPAQIKQQLTNPATAAFTATAISQALAASGNDCGSGPGQALAGENHNF
jgi:hypothetical protein